MTFRLRVLLLVVLVAFGATAVTAWLTVRQAAAQIESTQSDIELIKVEMLEYARLHGTWFDGGFRAIELSELTGQRIHMRDSTGQTVIDSDYRPDKPLNRKIGTTAVLIDPMPVLVLGRPADAKQETVEAIDLYRRSVLVGRCLTEMLMPPLVENGPYGLPLYKPDPKYKLSKRVIDDCPKTGGSFAEEAQDKAGSEDGRDRSYPDVNTGTCGKYLPCPQRLFAYEVRDVAPPPMTIYLGVGSQPVATLSARPALLLASGVADVAIIGTLLISRRLLRPIRLLMVAARSVGTGDLTARAPVKGRDELAELARSFNGMADSLQLAEERQKRMVADVAHELRTPLANLRGYLEALQDGVLPPDPELFAMLLGESVLQQRIVDDLQELALAEAGALVYHRAPCDLAELVSAVVVAHRSRAETSGVRLRADAPATVTATADPDRLRQVLGNLINNAIRATATGGSVTVRLRAAGGRSVVEVADTGHGIDEASLPHVFDRFWRADPARGAQSGGAGLGLAVAHRIVRDHDGTIEVTSEVGVGTTFAVTLPLAPAAPTGSG